MSDTFVGESLPRLEDERLVRGQGGYTDDIGHGAAEAAFVRSEFAHARILEIDVSDALEVEGVLAIYTYDDLSGHVAEPLPLLIPHPGLIAPRTQLALASDEVCYVGQTIMMVLARDRYIAEDSSRPFGCPTSRFQRSLISCEVKVMIRPERIEIEPHAATGDNRLPGVVERSVFLGGMHEVHVRVLGGSLLKATVANDGKPLSVSLDQGEAVSLHLPPSGLRVLTPSIVQVETDDGSTNGFGGAES